MCIRDRHSPPFASSMVPLHTGAKILSAARIRIAARQETAPDNFCEFIIHISFKNLLYLV